MWTIKAVVWETADFDRQIHNDVHLEKVSAYVWAPYYTSETN